jgi:leukotriene-A4 hydrolase
LGVKAKWLPIIPIGLKFVSSQGRMKFTRPVYRYKFINNRKHCYLLLNFILNSRDLFNWDESKQKAIENFKAQREFMHQTTAALVAKDLSL